MIRYNKLHGGIYMNEHHDEHFRFLQALKEELSAYEALNEEIQTLIMDELQDIDTALLKWQEGSFGKCEMSGDPIPSSWLQNVPTIKSTEEWNQLFKFGKVSIPFN
jgi:RNA polymerase-binding transcription factor DksA